MRRSVAWALAAIVVIGACGADPADVRTEGTPTVPSDATEPTGADATAPADATTPPTDITGPTSATAPDSADAPAADSVPGTAPATLRPSTEQPTPVTVAPGTVAPGTIDPALGGLIDLALADLAERLAVDAAAIAVVSAEAVVWPDGSLGCPQEGMAYTQVLVDGFRIVLEHGGVVFDYHGGGSRLVPFLCEQPAKSAPRPVPSAVTPLDTAPADGGDLNT